MKTSLLSVIFYFTAFCLQAQIFPIENPILGDYSRVKINTDEIGLQVLAEHGVAVDHGIRKAGMFFISDFSAQEIEIMQSLHFDIEILVADIESYYEQILTEGTTEQELHNATCSGNSGSGSSNFYVNPTTPSHFNLGSMGGYLTYTEMLAELDEMVSVYPNLVTPKTQISNYVSIENRPLYYVRLSDNPNVNESEPKVLYTAIHHAREPMSLMETIFYMWFLLENYGTNDEITYLVNQTQMYFVPCINPDGYVYNQTTNPNGGGMWRKNRRNNGGGVYGVDLNRNYSYGWGTTGTSTNTSNDTYCGTAAFSEPETQAMRWLVQNNHFITAFNAHTYAEDILFPIGTTTAEFAPHHNWFQEESNHQVQYNGYTAMKSSLLYPASGDSDDYMYKVDIGVNQKDTMFVHTPEVGTAFWQPSSQIISTCSEMLFPNLVLAHLSRIYTIVKDTDPGMIGTLNGVFSHSAQRLGREAGPVTVSIEPIQNIVSVGTPVVYNLAQQQTSTGSISFSLNPGIQFGNQIIYILKTDNGMWVRKDTIVKTYGALTVLLTENATSAANWTGTWSTTTSTYVSATKSFTDSPTGNYANNANKTYTFVPTVDLTNASDAMVRFYAKWNLEADYDYVQFQVSTDGGTNWIGQCGNYTVPGTSANGSVQPNNQPIYEGVQSSWVLEEINLSDYLGQILKFRFQLKSDGGTVADGYYFDDFEVLFNEIAPPVTPVASFTASTSGVCLGEAILFSDSSSNSPTGWAWDFGDGSQSTSQNPTHTFPNTGWYLITLTSSNGAGSSTFIDSVEVFSLPLVTLTSNDNDNIICMDQGPLTLNVTPSNTVLAGNALNGNLFDPLVSGAGQFLISAAFTDNNGCIGESSLLITVEDCSGQNEMSLQQIKIYPNPISNTLHIDGLHSGTEIILMDINGKILSKLNSKEKNTIIDVSKVSAGIYMIEINVNGAIRRELLLKK